jgi:hypothetical protein
MKQWIGMVIVIVGVMLVQRPRKEEALNGKA